MKKLIIFAIVFMFGAGIICAAMGDVWSVGPSGKEVRIDSGSNFILPGNFSVNGESGFNGIVKFYSSMFIDAEEPFFFGASTEDITKAAIIWDTTETRDSLKIGVGSSNYLIMCQTGDAISDVIGDVTATDPTFVVANNDISKKLFMKHDQIKFGNGEDINNSTDGVLDLSSAGKGARVVVAESNPNGVVDAPGGCVMIYSSGGSQYFMVNAGGTSWWGITMAEGSSLP